MSSGKHWCFTLNNYEETDVDAFTCLGTELPSPVVYLVFGRETGEQGTPHLQGFISFSKRKSLAFIKGLLCNRIHAEIAKGTPAQASTYCKKDGDFKEFGTVPGGQGTRTDLQLVAKKIREGTSFREVAEQHPDAVLRYGSGILRLRRLYRPERPHPPQIWIFWGVTGTGKTRRVWEFADKKELWVHPGDRWFCGYDGHKSVLFDDFDGSWFKLAYLLRLLDRYPMPVPVKGDQTWWCPSTIYITSNLKPSDWYPNGNKDHLNALQRRLDQFGNVVHCEGPYIPEPVEHPMND